MIYSAGLLLVRKTTKPEFLLLHLGGPFWKGRDEYAWSFPKGVVEEGEERLDAAKREWREETSLPLPPEPYSSLPLVGTRRKKVQTFLAIGDIDIRSFSSNTFEMEWPKGSGKIETFPEADAVQWFGYDEACVKIHKYLKPVLDHALEQIL
jgi:predicted NUDIX family NTP pyrophosphohydrolase